jgi:hypothetical protein
VACYSAARELRIEVSDAPPSLAPMEARIYAPSTGLETWRSRLADPETQWVRGKSAFETAVFWETGARHPRGLHPKLTALLDQEKPLRDCELIASFPEHRVRLPGGSRPSQTDVWAIGRSPDGLLSLAVEGKAGESFAETIGQWRERASVGKQERLTFLCQELGFSSGVQDSLRYQLVHRAASALLEAKRIGAAAAAMIVLSFVEDAKSKEDFGAFVTCCGTEPGYGRMLRASSSPQPLFLGWLDIPPATDRDIAALAT